MNPPPSQPPPTSSARRLLAQTRVLSFTEGISFLVLVLFAMPMKYAFDQPIYVKYVGWAHGVLFMLLGLWVLMAWRARAIGFSLAAALMIAALLPGGPFFMDRKLRPVE